MGKSRSSEFLGHGIARKMKGRWSDAGHCMRQNYRYYEKDSFHRESGSGSSSHKDMAR